MKSHSAFFFLLSCFIVLDAIASARQPQQPWKRSSSNLSSQQRPYSFEDHQSHFLDKEDWIHDKRARLYQDPRPRRRVGNLSCTSRIVFLNLAAFGLQVFRPHVTAWGVKRSEAILAGKELYRLVTPMFLHGGIFHLMTNMYSLKQVGPEVERVFGSGRFLATYAASGVMGTLVSAYKSPNPSLGASGAVFGTVGAFFVFLNRHDWLLGRFGENLSMSVAQTLAMNVVLGLMNPVIDNWAHLGGALGGAAMAYYFGPRLYLSSVPLAGGSMNVLVDKPIVRLPRQWESLPERVIQKTQGLVKRLDVLKLTEGRDNNKFLRPWQRSNGSTDYSRRQYAPTRSIKPGPV